ncbi:hypothetical protein E2C01_095111 [Portunus trituberculatus]|uniref:Uncharacterized protein n=1 Tax=Portunus trituberculatus TaxID=210409 RepID=A0A5B7JZ52_PORTR|nr:hypothetical protein [Portunus trituberculatus]
MRRATRQSKAKVRCGDSIFNPRHGGSTVYLSLLTWPSPTCPRAHRLYTPTYIFTLESHISPSRPLEVNTDSWAASQTPSTLWSRTKGVSVLARQQVRGYEGAVTPPAAERKS